MTKQELFERHKTMCEYCNIKKCDGIHITINNTTTCEYGEMNNPISQEIELETIMNDAGE